MSNPLEKFLPKQEDSKTFAQDMIERANAQFSCIDILNKEFGYDIPYGGVGSAKLQCLWGWEHKDGGVEKCMRYYWESDQAFCFRDHGVIDVVTIRASQKGLSRVKTATYLLQEAGLLKAEPWDVRIKKHQENLSTPKKSFLDLRLAEQLFNQMLKNVPNYSKVQFRPEIIQLKSAKIEELDPSWGLDKLSSWMVECENIMQTTIERIYNE